MSSQHSNHDDSAVVYTPTPFGGLRQQVITGNRVTDPLGSFLRYWTKFVSLPSNPMSIVCDTGIWVFTSSSIYILAGLTQQYLGLQALWLFTPAWVIILGIIIMFWVVDDSLLRLMSAIRLILIAIGITLVLL